MIGAKKRQQRQEIEQLQEKSRMSVLGDQTVLEKEEVDLDPAEEQKAIDKFADHKQNYFEDGIKNLRQRIPQAGKKYMRRKR